MPVSAFGQAAQARRPQAPRDGAACRPGSAALAIEEAVRMALENNLDIQIEKLNPQIQVLGVSRRGRRLCADAVHEPVPPQQHGAAAGLQLRRKAPPS